MTQRRLLIFCAIAIAIALAATPRHALMAQNNESKNSGDNSAQANSNPTSSSSSSNNQATDAQPSQSDAQKNQNSNASPQNDKGSSSDSSNNQGTSNNDPQRNDDQSARDRDAKSDARAPNDAKDDQNRNADRSTSKNDARDSQSDRASTDRSNRENRRDNRNANTRRDFRRDFKFGQSGSRGLVISSVVPDSIFYRSGLRNGDIIVSYNGQRIRSQDDFGRFVVYEPGRRVPIVVYRDGREETIYVVYDNNDAAQAPAGGSPLFGADFDPQSNDGAVIIRVQKGGPADRAGLQQNDLVVALNGEKVADGRQAIEMINRLQSGNRVEVEYMRHTQAQVTLGGGGTVSDTRFYRGGDDRGPSVATGVDTDQTRRDNSARDRNDNDRNRRDDDRPRRGILPRLRN
jgi:hypothetical protein